MKTMHTLTKAAQDRVVAKLKKQWAGDSNAMFKEIRPQLVKLMREQQSAYPEGHVLEMIDEWLHADQIDSWKANLAASVLREQSRELKKLREYRASVARAFRATFSDAWLG